ncbi:MAG TPA: tRNA preQ1(34) S-adenosylmethionine ribosyltransferase-isomerase QueA [Candidatus Magasanikbacteria bacterium]|nr:tRNA preQ1(34) S-adenosylmethionine ribosyltransferase-isomerase QueA [Candidatus Magasanikbacteria bacterium]
MLTSDFDYNLPVERIAQKPAVPRDSSRLMIVDRDKKTMEHRIFRDIVNYLQPGDLLVSNNSKVFKARLFGELESADEDIDRDGKKDGSLILPRKVEIFLVRPMENTGVWQVLAKPGKRVRPGMRVRFASDFYCDVVVKKKEGDILVQFPISAEEVRTKANKYGHIPVPPYVKDEPHEIESYQTVYAKHEGSVAAPTAGFHFTPELIDILKQKGVEFTEVTLHVGLGTFLPVKSERIADHTMHSEWVDISPEAVEAINLARATGRRVIAIGTTTVRTLEGVASLAQFADGKLDAYSGDINIFIKPGFEFKIVDAMITNFHLPKSTLLMLVSAFAGDREHMLKCYQVAIDQGYRFYSFGDAMFIY